MEHLSNSNEHQPVTESWIKKAGRAVVDVCTPPFGIKLYSAEQMAEFKRLEADERLISPLEADLLENDGPTFFRARE